MTPPTLIDTHGRVVRDLRISVTDRCNLRCVYCMPAEGMPWLARGQLLSYEEIARFAKVALAMGVHGIRLTGGEPTVRADLPTLVRLLNALQPGLDLSLTTNDPDMPLVVVHLAGEGVVPPASDGGSMDHPDGGSIATDGGRRRGVASAGGCGCRAGGGEAGSRAAIMLVLVGAALRRRRA